MVSRIVRHAMTMRIFREPEPGVVAHTKASRLLARPDIRDWVRAGTEELGPAGGKVRHPALGSLDRMLTLFLPAS